MALIEQWIRSLPANSTAGVASSGSAPASAGSAEAQTLLALVDSKAPQPERRNEALQGLVKSTEGSLALVSLLHRGIVSAEDSRIAVALGSQAPTDIRGLFETFLPESQRRKTLGANIDPAIILNLTGDRERGKLIFFSDGARCRACHQIDDRSQSLGPTLQEINKKYPRPAELLQHVLQPSLKIDDPFAAFAITTDDGRLVSGLLVEQTEQEVMLRTAEKQTVRIARKSIDEMRKSDKSLMPERILSDLTAQEAADLFEYMRSQGSTP